MVAGCALMIDYVLTIAVSIASGADAIFSFFPQEWQVYKLWAAAAGVVILIVLNMRGVKESVVPLVPIFLTFVATHAFVIIYSLVTHAVNFEEVASSTVGGVRTAQAELGLAGMLMLIMRSYAMGAGTFTGIEAVSNGLPILREPRVKTGKRTMKYMAISLAFTAMGLMIAYLLFRIEPEGQKTMNAILFERMTSGWGRIGTIFILVTLLSETTILFVAAQTGFLGGPMVLANMALDRWFPTRFAMLSDRLVTQNGILLMGGAALITMLLTGGSVRYLVVLYSINVFITFVLSQAGMVRHWWRERKFNPEWSKRITINGIGLGLCAFILVSVIYIKFYEGGWITILVTGTLVGLAIMVKRHYYRTSKMLYRLNDLMAVAGEPLAFKAKDKGVQFDPKSKTAVLFVNGYNGLGLHTLFSVIRLFSGMFKNFVFVQVGVIDAGNFKGASELGKLHDHNKSDVDKYVNYMKANGYYAEGYDVIGIDVVEEAAKIAPQILEKYPGAMFFGGQLVFPEDMYMSRWLHNNIVFSIQRRFYHQGLPFVILPIRV
jgi:hypothetical protein